MPPSVSIRPAVLADVPALIPLWESLDEHHRRARPDLFRVPDGPRRDPEQVRGLIEGSDGAILLAERAGTAVGLATLILKRPAEHPLLVTRPHVEMTDVFVAETARRLGIGRKLVDAARAWAMTHGLWRLELSVYDFNSEALGFYEDAGFTTLTRRLALPA